MFRRMIYDGRADVEGTTIKIKTDPEDLDEDGVEAESQQIFQEAKKPLYDELVAIYIKGEVEQHV